MAELCLLLLRLGLFFLQALLFLFDAERLRLPGLLFIRLFLFFAGALLRADRRRRSLITFGKLQQCRNATALSGGGFLPLSGRQAAVQQSQQHRCAQRVPPLHLPCSPVSINPLSTS